MKDETQDNHPSGERKHTLTEAPSYPKIAIK